MEGVLKGVRVIVIDDDADTRDLHAVILRDAGAEVESASTARDAMRSLLRWPVDVIVSDIMMPESDGCSMLREMRTVQQFRNVPAIAVTGIASSVNAEEAGFQQIMSKPLTPADLVAAVKRWADTVALSSS